MSGSYQLLPPLTAEERTALRDDIAEHGVQQPIVVDEHDVVIDGHHRLAIADELGVACPRSVYPGYSDAQKRSLAIRLNVHRRQLSREQRNELIATLRREGMTQRDIAEHIGVSIGTVNGALNFNSEIEDAPETIVNARGQARPARYDRQSDEDEAMAPGEMEAITGVLREEHGDDIPPETMERALEENLESKIEPELSGKEWQPSKPDLGDGISHPARYSIELLNHFHFLLFAYILNTENECRILDPFAGTGRIHELNEIDENAPFVIYGVEIEPEWARLHPGTIIGSALALPFDSVMFDAIVTSPTYGNRFADSHNASDPERRRSYTHDLGRDLAPENSGTMHWRNGGDGSQEYRTFHQAAWAEAVRVLRPGGVFILNMCDHVREGLVQPVTAWHTWCIGRLGLEYLTSISVLTRKLRQGANGSLREQEQVHVFRKPE